MRTTAVKKRRDWLKAQAAAHDDGWLFDQDEWWFSRFAQPNLHAWAAQQEPLRLVERIPAHKETEKALACFGAVRQDTPQTYLYFCAGQPHSEHMWIFSSALLALARQEKIRVVVMIWDRAAWHQSKCLRKWIRSYHQAAKQTGQPRLLTFLLPKKSPWLNPMSLAGSMPSARHVNQMAICPPANSNEDWLLILIPNHFGTLKLSDPQMH